MEGPNQRQIAEDWLKFSIENWRAELKRLKINHSSELFNSFNGSVIADSNGDVTKVAIAYAWYGQMVDMGVGRGTGNGDRADNALLRKILTSRSAGSIRKAKRWYSKGKNGIGYQTHKLAELLGKRAATETVEQIYNSISVNHIINLK